MKNFFNSDIIINFESKYIFEVIKKFLQSEWQRNFKSEI